jgi:hypothetical protein
LIRIWHDRKIAPGSKWAGVIDENYRSADLILLLVSIDFFASDYCYEIEKTALERYTIREARVVLVFRCFCERAIGATLRSPSYKDYRKTGNRSVDRPK